MRTLLQSLALLSFLYLAGCSTTPHDADGHHHDDGHHEHAPHGEEAVPDATPTPQPGPETETHSDTEPAGHFHPEGTPADHEHEDGVAILYRCEMHPEVIEAKPGRCPVCGMHLKPVPAEE